MKKVLDHGFVELVDHMPQENLDKAIVDGAREVIKQVPRPLVVIEVLLGTLSAIGILHP